MSQKLPVPCTGQPPVSIPRTPPIAAGYCPDFILVGTIHRASPTRHEFVIDLTTEGRALWTLPGLYCFSVTENGAACAKYVGETARLSARMGNYRVRKVDDVGRMAEVQERYLPLMQSEYTSRADRRVSDEWRTLQIALALMSLRRVEVWFAPMSRHRFRADIEDKLLADYEQQLRYIPGTADTGWNGSRRSGWTSNPASVGGERASEETRTRVVKAHAPRPGDRFCESPERGGTTSRKREPISMNNITLSGRLTKAIRSNLVEGTPVVNFTVAVEMGLKPVMAMVNGKEQLVMVPSTSYVEAAAWGPAATAAATLEAGQTVTFQVTALNSKGREYHGKILSDVVARVTKVLPGAKAKARTASSQAQVSVSRAADTFMR